MSRMSDLDVICEDLRGKAKLSLESGETPEDITASVFVQLFNWSGMDPELRDWAMSTANMVLSDVFEEVDNDAVLLRKKLDNLLETLWHLENLGHLETVSYTHLTLPTNREV